MLNEFFFTLVYKKKKEKGRDTLTYALQATTGRIFRRILLTRIVWQFDSAKKKKKKIVIWYRIRIAKFLI